MGKTLIVHSDNIISRYAWLIEKRMQGIDEKRQILQHPERYGHKLDLGMVESAMKFDAECLQDLVSTLMDGSKSPFIAPDLDKILANYVTEVIGDAAE